LRLLAVVGGVLLFVALGIVSTRGGHFARDDRKAGGAEAKAAVGQPSVVTVSRQKTRTTLPLESTFEPLRTVSVIAGLGGTVSELHFHYGQRVKEGDPLLDIDTTTEEVALRAARVETIRAEERVHELEDWESGAAMSGA